MPDPRMPSELDARELVDFKNYRDLIFAFENVLDSNGVQIESNSILERICLEVISLEDRRQDPSLNDNLADIRPALREASGLLSVVRKVVKLSRHPDFHGLVQHLRLMNGSMIPQNVRVSATDQGANKIFELLVALLCMDVGAAVRIDHPDRSAGDNPDVLATIDGQRWGFACKVLHGTSPLTFFERLEEGINQIERSEAAIGVVIFNMKNLIDHDSMWPILNLKDVARGAEPSFGSWRDKDRPIELLLSIAGQKHAELIDVNSIRQVASLFENTKSVPGALSFLQTGTAITTSVGPMITSIGVFVYMDLLLRSAPHPVLDRLNSAMHDR
jgi:hypothetical protein